MTGSAAPHQLADYHEFFKDFRPESVEAGFSGDYLNGINACVECVDRHVAKGGVALEWESQDGRRATISFAELQEQTARFANLLTSRGVKAGDVVAGMLPRTPELLVVILGTLRAGAVYQPMFTAFGPKAIEHRLKVSGAKLIVTDVVNRPKMDEVAGAPEIATITRIDKPAELAVGDLDFRGEMARASTQFAPVLRHGDDLMLMMSTSGTTGLPKGVPVPMKALSSFLVYMRDAIDLREGDKYWNIADPGWAYGLYYAVIGPLLLGHATTFYEGPFTVESTYGLIERHAINNLAGAPTAYRLLIAAGPEAAAKVKGKLRVVSSAGEALNPEVIRWFGENLAAPINNHHGLRHVIHAGSAGLAMPGYRVTVLDEQDREVAPHVPGVLAIDVAGSSLFWFTGYWQQDTPSLGGGYYRTGDMVELEPDGHISFVGRADDVITSSGYRIGPFDVESALIEHPDVVEAAVIGKPDVERTEIVKAFVVLRQGAVASPELAEEMSQFVKRRLSAHAYPREIEFIAQLPKTPSGKLQRFILRNNEKAAPSH